MVPPVRPYRGTRSVDAWGAGGFGAPRRDGDRMYKHDGLDIKAEPGDESVAPIGGYIVHEGQAYQGSNLRSIHIRGRDGTPDEGLKVVLLYVQRLGHLTVGTEVEEGEVIGVVQDVAGYHAAKNPQKVGKMTNHVHLKVFKGGVLIDPNHVLNLPADPEVA